jgi:hypothetical protein
MITLATSRPLDPPTVSSRVGEGLPTIRPETLGVVSVIAIFHRLTGLRVANLLTFIDLPNLQS